MKIFIKEEDCIGCGLCQNICPECFKVEDGIAKVVGDCDQKTCDCDAEEVVESCPCNAIKIKFNHNGK